MSISKEFADILRAGRPQFNAQVVKARHQYPNFDTEAFNLFLQNCVDPLVTKINSDQRGLFCVDVFDLAIDLVGRGLIGGHVRGQLIQNLWNDAVAEFISLLLPRPSEVLASLTNALLNLEASNGRDVAKEWLVLLRQYAGSAPSSEVLIQLGVVFAWRAGAPQYRTVALRIIAEYPDFTYQALGLTNSAQALELSQTLGSNPWDSSLTGVKPFPRTIGEFAGLGGELSQPPKVRPCPAGFVVESGDRYFLLIVDCFGQMLLPSSKQEFNEASQQQYPKDNNLPLLKNGSVFTKRLTLEIDLPLEELQLVWNDYSAAIYSPYSFAIRVMPFV
ncbi:MAG: hypothetical protein VB958_16435 [Thalassolituus sp.]|uniref:hypothetical protein n=1 Tax=Thalassolituus sp. TaxID=2030822 RepID=UPI003982D1E3